MKAKILSGLLFLSLMFFTSCDEWIDPAINIDPNAPEDVSLDVLLPSAQANIGYQVGSDINRIPSVFMQYYIGTARQHLGYWQYVIKEDDLNNCWLSMYTGAMIDLDIAIQKAEENGSPHYKGVANILMAYSIGTWTDLMGDIPYSEAFQGNENLTPKYDSQESIYQSIQMLLDEAITALQAGESTFSPGADDMIYGGDPDKWIKAAYSLKARYYLHLGDYANALTALANGFADHTDDLQFMFGTVESEANPLFQFLDQRGDINFGPQIADIMNPVDDPRLPMYALSSVDTVEVYDINSPIGPFYGSMNSPIVFMSHAELKFIEAECNLAQGNQAAAYQAYMDGIQASMDKVGVEETAATAFLENTDIAVGEANLTLEHIMHQKYVALYTQVEAFTDWRRTGFPDLEPVTGNKIPRRFFYPQNERLYNNANLNAVPDYSNSPNYIFTEIWWDKTYWN